MDQSSKRKLPFSKALIMPEFPSATFVHENETFAFNSETAHANCKLCSDSLRNRTKRSTTRSTTSTDQRSVFRAFITLIAFAQLASYFLLLLLPVIVVESFNLEPRLPIIKRGVPDTFFGYSVAQHADSRNSSLAKKMLLIGAPQSESNLPNARRSGAIFSCPFSPDENDCRSINLSGAGGSGIIVNDGFKSDASRAWLGISLSSQGAGRSVLACAHLYRKSKLLLDNSTVIQIPGICYSFDRNLQFKTNYDGCQGLPWADNEKSPHELYGQCLHGVGAFVDTETNEMLFGAPGALDYTGFVYQKWIERKFGMDTSTRYSSEKMEAGRENLMVKNSILTLTDSTSESPPTETGPLSGKVVRPDSYLGMSVIMGRFLSKSNESMKVAGAPRSKLTGEVVAFTSSPSKLVFHGRLRAGSVGAQFGYALAKADVNGDGREDLFVGAPGFFDFRGGGGRTLPHATGEISHAASTHHEAESTEMVRYGAVYVYYNRVGRGVPFSPSPAGLSSPKSYDTVLYGKSSPDSRFGAALAGCGDLNNDGFDDLAVGAPFQDDGRGAVYIFQGSERGLNREASQIITSAMLPFGGLMSFGAALSGGLDMDNNGYPDLLVGAFESNAAVLLLSRPVVKIFTEVRDLPERGINASGEPCQGSNRVCFMFKVCLDLQAVSNSDSRTQQQVYARYRIEGDVVKTLPATKRVSFANRPPQQQQQQELLPRYIIERQLLLNTADTTFNCIEEVVFLEADAADTLNPLLFRLQSELVEKIKPEYPLRQLPNMDDYPIFDRLSASKSFQVNFTNDCGADNICESDLRLENVRLDLPRDDEYELKNETDLPRYLLVGGASDKLNLTFNAVNRGEKAYQAKLYVDHPSVLPLVRFYAPAGITCAVLDRRAATPTDSGDENVAKVSNFDADSPSENEFVTDLRTIVCDLGNPLAEAVNNPLEITIEFESRNVQPLDNEIAIVLRTDTISQKLQPAQAAVRVVARVVVRADAILLGTDPQGQVIYDGDARGASALLMLSDVGSPVVHEYELYNDGPGALPTSSLTIFWPIEIAPNKRPESEQLKQEENFDSREEVYYKHNKWLLYLSAKPEFDSELGVRCTYDEKYINPLGFAGGEKTKQILGVVSRRFGTSTAGENMENTQQKSRQKRDEKSTSSLVAGESSEPADAAELRNTKISPDYEDVSKNKKVVTFDCDRARNARCIPIVCKIPTMERGATTLIRIYSRLWKHTFLQDYRNVDYVRIVSLGQLTIDPVYRIQQGNISNDVARAITRAIPSASITADEVQKLAPWVIPLAVGLGLLLLICIILALWKCGFFSRHRYGINSNERNGVNGDVDEFALNPTYTAAGAIGVAGGEGRADDLNETFITTPHHTTGVMLPVRMKKPPREFDNEDEAEEVIEEYDTKKFIDQKVLKNNYAEDANLNQTLLSPNYPSSFQQPPVVPPKPALIQNRQTPTADDAVRFNRNGNGSSNHQQQPTETVVIDPSRRRLAGGAAGVYNSNRRARGPVG